MSFSMKTSKVSKHEPQMILRVSYNAVCESLGKIEKRSYFLHIYLSVCVSIHLSIHPSMHSLIYLKLDFSHNKFK